MGDLATFLQDVNDHAPECEPPFQELTIHTSPGRRMEVTKVLCREPQCLAFSYSIVGGKDHGGRQDVGEEQARPAMVPFFCHSAFREQSEPIQPARSCPSAQRPHVGAPLARAAPYL